MKFHIRIRPARRQYRGAIRWDINEVGPEYPDETYEGDGIAYGYARNIQEAREAAHDAARIIANTPEIEETYEPARADA